MLLVQGHIIAPKIRVTQLLHTQRFGTGECKFINAVEQIRNEGLWTFGGGLNIILLNSYLFHLTKYISTMQRAYKHDPPVFIFVLKSDFI